MGATRHVYRPPKGRFTDALAALGGLMAAGLVFVLIPLTQKLSDMLDPAVVAPEEVAVQPPEEEEYDYEQPPEEVEPEPEPEEMPEEAVDLDIGLEAADLGAGTGGGFVMEIPKFGAAAGEDPFGGGFDGPPVPVNRLPPQYPSALLKKGIGGRVVVTCVIDENGALVSTKVRQSSGHAELDKAALAAVARWKFNPATRGGRKIKATCNIPFSFEVRRS